MPLGTRWGPALRIGVKRLRRFRRQRAWWRRWLSPGVHPPGTVCQLSPEPVAAQKKAKCCWAPPRFSLLAARPKKANYTILNYIMPQVASRFFIYAFVLCHILEHVIYVFVSCRILERVIYAFALCRILEHVIYVFVFCRILERAIYVFVFPSYSGAHNLCVRIPPVRMYPLLGCIPEHILYVLFYIPLPLIEHGRSHGWKGISSVHAKMSGA